jgi:UDP-N-acetylglucosamine 2-epimerase (non-hydrolysing)
MDRVQPDAVLVQGDTLTTFGGALTAFLRRVPVAHVEAGLRTDSRWSPFPEEVTRRSITEMASYHFAATPRNRAALIAAGVSEDDIVLTGNPIVDALQWVQANAAASDSIKQVLSEFSAHRIIVLTTHRRENFGAVMRGNLRVLRRYVERHLDSVLLFPVHPNPQVRAAAASILGDAPRIRLIDPLTYPDFVSLLSKAWLIVSDSGGVQEEAPSLGRPVLVIRDRTERPEAVECGAARLVPSPDLLQRTLRDITEDPSWIESVRSIPNPFGTGDAGIRISDGLTAFLQRDHAALAATRAMSS